MKKRAVLVLLMLLLVAGNAAALQMTKPVFGVAQAQTFDVEVTTSSALNCRYASPFSKPYSEMTDFSVTGGTTHTLTGFTVPAFGTEYDFFVNCGDGSEQAQLKVMADNTNPAPSITANPAQVVQTPLQSKLKVTASEAVNCRYDETAQTFAEMASQFSGADNVKANYVTNTEKTLSGLKDGTDYSYNVICKDLSGRESGLSTITVSVNTAAEPVIINYTPASNTYTTEDNVFISVTTNKNSQCEYGTEQPPTETGGTFNVGAQKHENRIQLAEGSYTYNFHCLFEGPKELTAQTTFVIDKTKPVMKFVNDSQEQKDVPEQYSYRIDRLKIKFDAEDEASGIKQYNYTIISGSQVVKNWTITPDADITARDIELEDGKRYIVRAKAQNNAGLWSDTLDSDGVTVDVSLNLEEACRNNVKDNDESDVDCGGSCGRCPVDDSCRTNSDCISGYCSGKICVSASCNDGLKNQDETDVDCGGKCGSCLEGDKCKKASDCRTGICSESICVSAGPCANKVKDDFETDVDCGGICAELKDKLCIRGRGCAEDSDCTSGTCGIDRKCAAVGDPDYDAIVSSIDNCPRAANKGQEDGDNDGIGDACDDDNDNDGMSDEYETKYNLNPFDASDADDDNDSDGLTNLQEFNAKTNPNNPDTDGDGVSDAKEIEKRTNPNDANSKPGMSRLVVLLVWMLILLGIFVVLAYFYYRKITGPARETKKELEKRKAADAAQEPRPVSAQEQFQRKYHTQPQHPVPKQMIPQRMTPRQPPHNIPHPKGNIDALREEHKKMSGEEVFEKLKKHTRRR